MPFKITKEISNEEMNYYINRLQWIDAVNIPLEKAINDLLAKLKPMFGISDGDFSEGKLAGFTPTDRETNTYYEFGDQIELDRLNSEGEVLYSTETAVYDKIMFGRDDMNVLDVNVLNPSNQSKLLYRKEVKFYLGLCYNSDAVDAYNAMFPQEDSHYCYIDFTDMYFDVKLKAEMANHGIKGFDLINLSMVILDLKDPVRILQKLRRFLNPGGMFYIRDIDDGLNVYYPDSEDLFKQYFKLADADKFAGFRKIGRQIYSYLKHLGAKKITLELNGLSNVSMSYMEKDNLFKAYMTFLSHEYKRLVHESPENEKYREANTWLVENMPIIEETFFEDDFFFIAGYIIYTAEF